MAGLVKALDKTVKSNRSSKLSAVVNFEVQAKDDFLEKARLFGPKHNVENVALTVTGDGSRFRVNDDVELTVMMYRNKVVKFNYVVEKKVTKKDIQAIVAGTKKILE